jgi:NADH-quinone oxidoreductase subunit J
LAAYKKKEMGRIIVDAETIVMASLSVVAVLSSIGVLLSRDNLYATLYMILSLIMIGTIYAAFNLQPVFILIVFVFVGALGVVTVVLASTYRVTAPQKVSVNVLWALPVGIAAAVICLTVYASATGEISIPDLTAALIAFPSEYFLLIAFLVSLMAIVMLSVIKFMKEDEA